jgi:hypothetical protein
MADLRQKEWAKNNETTGGTPTNSDETPDGLLTTLWSIRCLSVELF